jgi:hypothetical protein
MTKAHVCYCYSSYVPLQKLAYMDPLRVPFDTVQTLLQRLVFRTAYVSATYYSGIKVPNVGARVSLFGYHTPRLQ